ncbi:HlyD family type I secretion periplasmic adaptor subunit [Benzoatithermus flavus]|uniref:Membrane fusion protein (MFP) family protein n=1 Tax=Benzoatithermus flavus TaxID=3108223 RepID=A0ABU8XQU9_9PROT
MTTLAAAPSSPGIAERAATLNGPLLAAAAIILVFFGGFGGWAAFAPLSGAAVAPAVVAPEGYRKTVQHLEGGIVREIRVRDGSSVEAGDVLVVLDDTQIRATYAAAQAKLAAAQARAARLFAERSETAEPEFPAELLELGRKDAETQRLIEAERETLHARRQALADQVAVLERRIAQAQTDLVAYEGNLTSTDRQISLIDEEIETVKDLLAKGLDRKPRLLALQRARADLEAQRTTALSSSARTRELINATRAELASTRSKHAEEVATGLVEAQGSANQLQAQVRAVRDQLERVVIRAPVAGTVVNLQLHTAGGVIRAGEPILEIVPRDEPLVIEARVSPSDIDVVHPGLTADVHLLAYRSRHLPRIQGEVRKVSADRLIDQKTGQPYYSAQIVVDTAVLHRKAPEVELTAGMPAEALIITGKRTLFEYLMEPVRLSFRRALRET